MAKFHPHQVEKIVIRPDPGNTDGHYGIYICHGRDEDCIAHKNAMPDAMRLIKRWKIENRRPKLPVEKIPLTQG